MSIGEIRLDSHQQELLVLRSNRKFVMRCAADGVREQIENALRLEDLYKIVKKYNLCDICNFEGLNIISARIVLNCIIDVIYKYPRLRSRLSFIGSKHGFAEMVGGLRGYEQSVIKKLGIQYIVDSRGAKAIADELAPTTDDMKDGVLAKAFGTGDFIGGIIIDETNFCTEMFEAIKDALKQSVESGHFPKGCFNIASVIYHELGHLLDFLCSVSQNEELFAKYSQTPKTVIAKELSRYSAQSVYEYVAEGFAEIMSNPKPRKTAKFISAKIDQCYGELDKRSI